MICDFRDRERFNDFPYVLIDGEGELIDDSIRDIDLTTGVGIRVDLEGMQSVSPDMTPDEVERSVYVPVQYVPPLTLVSGSGLVVAQGAEPGAPEFLESIVRDCAEEIPAVFTIVESSP